MNLLTLAETWVEGAVERVRLLRVIRASVNVNVEGTPVEQKAREWLKSLSREITILQDVSSDVQKLIMDEDLTALKKMFVKR